MTQCNCPKCQLILALISTIHESKDCKCKTCEVVNSWMGAFSNTMLVFPSVDEIVGFNKDEVLERLNEESNNPEGLNVAYVDHLFNYLASNPKRVLTPEMLAAQVEAFMETSVAKQIVKLYTFSPTHSH